MRLIFVFFFLTLFLVPCSGQSLIAKNYELKDFEVVFALGKDAASLTADDTYLVGKAYYYTSQDSLAVHYFTLAEQKGLVSEKLQLNTAQTYAYLGKFLEAQSHVEKALQIKSNYFSALHMKAKIFQMEKKNEDALALLIQCAQHDSVTADALISLTASLSAKEDYASALSFSYKALELCKKEQSDAKNALLNIGTLEEKVNKDKQKAIYHFEKALELDSTDYSIYSYLLPSLNEAGLLERAEAVFQSMRRQHTTGTLQNVDDTNCVFGRYWIDGKRIIITRSLVEPREVIDISYHIYVIDQETVERHFAVEKTFQLRPDSPSFLLCELLIAGHRTFGLGWKEETIPYLELKKAVQEILEDKEKPAAQSTYSDGDGQKKKKKRKKSKDKG
jgi:tetratricopeptide (TPR) repeat protein